MSELSKEAIIKKYEPYPNKAEVNIIGVMMEEYAKQEAMAFADFMVDGTYDYVSGDYDGIVTFDKPIEEIYNAYQQSKTKQP